MAMHLVKTWDTGYRLTLTENRTSTIDRFQVTLIFDLGTQEARAIEVTSDRASAISAFNAAAEVMDFTQELPEHLTPPATL